MGTEHYSLAQRPAELYNWANDSAKKLVKGMESDFKGLTPVLVYAGLSGISHATALSMVLHKRTPHFMFYRRKKHERAHGNERWEHNIPSPDWRLQEATNIEGLFLVFVDDLVSSGITKKRCLTGVVECMNHDMYNGIKFYSKKYMQLLNDYNPDHIRDDIILNFHNRYEFEENQLISA